MTQQTTHYDLGDRILIGERIRMERTNRGLTQTALGRQLGISPSYVSALERGQRRLSGSVSEKLHHYFDLSYDYLLEGKHTDSIYQELLKEPESPGFFHKFQVMLATCNEDEMKICYHMCHSYISTSRRSIYDYKHV